MYDILLLEATNHCQVEREVQRDKKDEKIMINSECRKSRHQLGRKENARRQNLFIRCWRSIQIFSFIFVNILLFSICLKLFFFLLTF